MIEIKRCGFYPRVRKIPFQYSCLENHMGREAWWATVHRVTKSRTLLKQFSTHTCMNYITELIYIKNVSRHPSVLNKKAWVLGWLGNIAILKNDIYFFKPGDGYKE